MSGNVENTMRRNAVQVRILYTQGCANTPPTVRLLENIAQELNIPVDIQMVVVDTPEHAQEFRFLGSPTVRIGGSDIDPSARGSLGFGLT